MRTIGVYNYNLKDFGVLEDKLKTADIVLKSLGTGQTEEGIALYAFNIDSDDGFKIKFDYPFIIFSSLNDSVYLRNSLKVGALDFIHKPFVDIELVMKRIQRIVEKIDSPIVSSDLSNMSRYDKTIDVEIKRAHRGHYPLYLGKISFETKLNEDVLTKITKKIKEVLRDSDSCMLYPDGSIYILLPFTDQNGVIIAVRKIIEYLNNSGYKGYCICSNYPNDGDNREELIKSLGASLDTREIYI